MKGNINKKMEDKVDILLTTYNTNPKFLNEQINSILNQTYSNFNLIISDDFSSNENVVKILKEFEKKDNRIKLYIQEKNIGCTKSFEFLLTKSTSEYIAFSDHDDIWYPTKIEECVKAIKEENVSLVYCDANQIDKDGNILNESYLRYKNLPILTNKKQSILPFSRHIAIGCSQLITKEVKDIMLPFTDNTFAHDWHSLYIASRLNGIYCIDKPLLGYRIHENNIFGGRDLKQNIKIWKNKNGNNYKSFLEYRYNVITNTYLAGTKMCKDYSNKIKDNNLEILENNVLEYFKQAQKSKIFYWKLYKYFKYLYFKGIGKRLYKEIVILHFPIISYLVFKMVKNK